MRLRKRSPCFSSTFLMRAVSMMSQPKPMRMPPGGRMMLMFLKPRNTRNTRKEITSKSPFRVFGVFRGDPFSGIHQRFHGAHSLVDAAGQCTANDAVADVELVEVRNRAHFGDVDVVD